MFFGGSPFGGGGFPGGGHPGMRRREQKPIDNTGYYKLLGVEKGATGGQIKKAFRKLAKKHHPDRGGDAEKFAEMTTAYEVLSDADKRKKYDKYGVDGLKEGGGGGGDASDIFSQFFGGGGGRRQSADDGPKKGKPIMHKIALSMADMFKGKTMRLRITRKVICREGEDKPLEVGQELLGCASTCSTCRGRGAVMRTHRLGPGFVQQVQAACPSCAGQGKGMEDGYVQKEKRELMTVEIPKGCKDGAKIVKENMGDMSPGMLPSDVVFVIAEKDHKTFKRRGADLLMEKEVTLLEALCGIKFEFQHLDGKRRVVTTSPGEVIKPKSIKCVPDLGMPVPDTIDFGRLFIVFDVKFPTKGALSSDQTTALEALLGPRKREPKLLADTGEGEAEEMHYIEDVDPDTFGKSDEDGSGALGSDDEGGNPMQGARQVQCAQQ